MSLPTPNRTQPWYDWANVFIRAIRPQLPTIITGSATLGTGTSTTVSVFGLTARQRVFLQPRTAAAFSAGASVTSITDGSFVAAHASGASDRTVDYFAI